MAHIRTITGHRFLTLYLMALLMGAMLCPPASLAQSWPKPPSDIEVQKKVKEWVVDRLAVPKSYQDVNWSKVVDLQGELGYSFAVRHVYRFRHPNGAVYSVDRIFMFDYAREIEGVEDMANFKEPFVSRFRPLKP